MKFSKLFGIIFFISGTLCAFSQKAVPSVEIKTLDGKTVNLREFAENGKITVLNMWATWCSPCKKELDAIAELYPGWKEKYNMELVAITIDTRRALAKVRPMVESKGWEYTILSDVDQQLRTALNFQAIPQSYLIDQKGNIVYAHSGYVPGDEYELEKKIRTLTGK